MASEANRRAAAQMERDGIRSLPFKGRRADRCKQVVFQSEGITITCGKFVRYATPAGNRCAQHAITKARGQS